jgi:hypothetical protein
LISSLLSAATGTAGIADAAMLTAANPANAFEARLCHLSFFMINPPLSYLVHLKPAT